MLAHVPRQKAPRVVHHVMHAGSAMRSKIVYYTLGLITGLLIWFVGDRVGAYLREQRYLAATEQYEAREFMEPEPSLDVEAVLDLDLTLVGGGGTASMRSDADKVLFVNLWATWCTPCIQELRSIEELRARVGEKVAFYLLSDEPLDSLQEFLGDHEYRLPFYAYEYEGSALEQLTSEGVPRTFIIYKGQVRFDHLGAAPWNSEKVLRFLDGLLEDA